MSVYASHDLSPSTLEALFSSGARVATLRLFLLDPLRAYYQRQIEATTGLALRAIQRELERLTESGLLYRRMEGNRAYYQVDLQFPLFQELRALVLKTATEADRLRGSLTMDENVRLAFLCETDRRALVVTTNGRRPSGMTPGTYTVEVMSMEQFAQALHERPTPLSTYLVWGADLLGRRDDPIWRHITAANFTVAKAKGVA